MKVESSKLKVKNFFLFLAFLSTFIFQLSTVSAETALSSKEQAKAAFQKGKALYDQGRYAQAFAEWEAAEPVLDGQPVAKTIQFLKNRIDPALIKSAILVTEAAPKPPVQPEPEPIAESTVEPPQALAEPAKPETDEQSERPAEEAGKLVGQAAQKIEADAKAQAEKLAQEQNAATEEAQKVREIQASFEAGKTALAEGRYEDVLVQWKGLVADERLAVLRESLEKLKAVEEAPLPVETASPEFEKEIEELLSNADSELVNRAKQSAERHKKALEAGRARAQDIKKAFASGKSLLEKGDVDAAAKAWEPVLAALKSPAPLREQIQKISETHRRVLKMEALAAKPGPARVPLEALPQEKQILELLQETSVRLTDKRQALEADLKARTTDEKKAKAEAAALEETFQKGRKLYENGRIAEAAEVWAPLTPRMANRALLDDLIEDIRSQNRQIEAVRAVALRSARNQTLTHEKEIKKMLSDGSDRLKADTPGLAKGHRLGKVSVEMRPLGARDPAWVRTTFEQGKAMYEAKRTREAFLLWGTILPYISKEPQIKAYIDKAAKASKAGA